MTEQSKRKGGGGQLKRSEVITVRFDPKLQYLASLAARKHSRTLSSYIEWQIKTGLEREDVRPVNTPAHAAAPETIGTEAEYLWDVEEADRFAKLSLRYPHLLTHDEQVLWKLIRESSYFWDGYYDRARRWIWRAEESSINFQRLRAHWPTVCAVAQGSLARDQMPTWPGGHSQATASDAAKTGFDDMDDDIPF
ncbi:MAG: hypothetical protein H7255_14010 [Ramlibacter sp.]|nr:hypothetical protein [Ramlibacter sp.]